VKYIYIVVIKLIKITDEIISFARVGGVCCQV